MRIYISGPITGLEPMAQNLFIRAEAELEIKYPKASIINPFWLNGQIFGHFKEIPTHTDYMATSMAMLSVCNTIYLMRGWEHSEGCQQEYKYAVEHRYKIIFQQAR
ncbi:MAG: DUF4406 domain-containing protein [Prevotella sp.]|nr:DUF4406 domain-containing protein [Prevotella sp.]